MNMRPPNVKASWDECDVKTKASLLAYEQIRSHEESEELAAQLGAKPF